MHTRGTLTRTGLFLGLLACALLALAPTLARAQRALQLTDPMWVALHEVCVAQGVVKVVAQSDDQSVTANHEDCRYCQGAATLGLPPPAELGLHTPLASCLGFPQLYWQAPSRLHAWLTPAPRGPPSRA
jgi:hypothetical protein